MIRNLSSYAQSFTDTGSFFYQPIQKSSLPNAGSLAWSDLSMGAGIPKFNAYVGSQATATPLIGQKNDSIYTGHFGSEKYLHKLMLQTGTANGAPNFFILNDYVMAYPLIDLDSTDLQEMDNTESLPRYSDGVGLQMFAVVTTPMSGSASCVITYTDVSNASRVITTTLVQSSVTGGLCSSSGAVISNNARAPFLPIINGIKKLDSVQMLNTAGGFAAFVICKPLAEIQMFEVGVPCEIQFIKQKAKAPQIQDGAFLNFIMMQGGSSPPLPLNGLIEFINI
jgi:hypothetical protein